MLISARKEMPLAGRKAESERLRKAWSSEEAELIAIYGRRRIGKTYLIRSILQEKGGYMEVTGLKDGSMEEQLAIFSQSFQEIFFGGVPIQPMRTWNAAFQLFTAEMKKLRKNQKFVLFLDELPWLSTPKSGLLQALDHYWNTEWSKLSNLKVVLCGSAASWMLEHLIHAKGGLHNRITQRMHLQPFTLFETEIFLRGRGISLERAQIVELYMAFGGVPFYLKEAEKGKSAAQIINRACFSKNGTLRDEFERLFPSLFTHSEVHLGIFREISRQRSGMSRTELIEKLDLPSGGRFNQRIHELEEAGFITALIPYGNKRKEVFYRAIDEYCYFHSKWIAGAPKGIFTGSSSRYWEQKRGSPAWRAWAGYSFEGICLKHAESIRAALGIETIDCETGSWRFMPPKKAKEHGAQVDLLFDRSDGVITLCEIKHCESEFVIDKAYATELERKIEIFRKKHRTRKQVFLTMITTRGVAKNMYYGKFVHSDLTLDALF